MLRRLSSRFAALALSTARLPQQGSAQNVETATPQLGKVGTQGDFTFDQPLLEGRGIRSLRELRGKPVLLEFWGRT